MAYDVIIAGGSFAGLAVASQLRGRLLVIEPNGIGERQTSACGTLLGVPERLGLMDSVLQIHRELVLHTPTYTEVVDVSENPFCTFDYGRFCRGMAESLQADFLRARALALHGRSVVTDRGRFEGEIFVDASGWRAALGNPRERHRHRRRLMNFGIETVSPRTGDKMCFWFDPVAIPRGVAWLFPAGRESRIGVGSYLEENHLGPRLEFFLDSLGLIRRETHGGYFPAVLQAPTEGNLFRVGDAAGQCLPLTGEGIRPAIYFGQVCGSIIQEILNGRIGLEEGLESYRAFVAQHQRLYWVLRAAQTLLVNLYPPLARSLLLLACKEAPLSYILPRYLGFADPKGLRPLHRGALRDQDGGTEIAPFAVIAQQQSNRKEVRHYG